MINGIRHSKPKLSPYFEMDFGNLKPISRPNMNFFKRLKPHITKQLFPSSRMLKKFVVDFLCPKVTTDAGFQTTMPRPAKGLIRLRCLERKDVNL